MKRILLPAAILLTLAHAIHAQINQVGTQQFAQQNRIGPTQIGDISQVQGQNGTNFGNYAITFQNGSVDGTLNGAYIRQNNGSQGNRAGITQTGGPNNFAEIDQNGGALGLSGGASSTSATLGKAGELGNFAGIAQLGANNSAVINQSNLSQLNGSEIYQNGTNNKALVDQIDNSVGNLGFIFQGFTGQGQIGPAISNAKATITQTGPNPRVGGTTGESIRNLATITQTASEASALISQGSIPARFADDFTQTPSANTGGRATGSVASIDQLNQAAEFFLSGIFVGIATSRYVGAYIGQGTVKGVSLNSSASIVQTNRYNAASINQGTNAGSDNGSIARISQTGAGYIGELPNLN